MECLQVIKEAIPRKTVSKWRFRLVICWIAVGTVLCGAFSIVESKESRFDFRCDVRDEIDKDIIRDECYDQYLQSHEIGIPSYFFILVNVSLIPIVTALYSYCVKSTVSSYQDVEGEPRNQKGSRRLFSAYLFQLVVSIALGITFIALLQTHLLYPTNFPCSNTKFSVKFVSNRTQSTKSFSCFHNRAGKKNFWTKTATAANAIYATSALLEILLILKRARGGKILMNDRQFYADYLKSNSDEERLLKNDTQNDVQSDIQTLRENCLRDTEQPSDLLQPFGRLNPGEGHTHDLKMDDIYVNVAIREGRAHHYSAKPEDIINKEKTNVLVFGRPGIGKTSFCTKILRQWASGEAFNGDHGTTSAHFDVVFLVKFRLLNDNAELSLRELLARAETIQSLDDPVWDFINKDPTKVLLIFDGLDEYSRKEDINAQDDDDPTYKNDVEEKIPVSVLYNKLAAGKLLRGASILTTTRPKAVEFVEHVNFQTTVEIRGFTSENVEEYVEKFTRDVPGAKEKILGHIKSNINLLSLCYIPENCFFICHCLLQIILSEPPQALPKKMTDIYKMTVKMFLFNHNREGVSPEELERLKSTHLYKPFDKFPEELQNILSSLREISFKGIEEGRRLFESSEVGDLEDCGLLHKLPDLKRQALDDPSKSQFCFTHLTMQEFFAAKHLVDTKTDEGIEEFVCNHVNNSTWQVVLQFVAGLLQSSSDIFIKLLPESKATKTIERSSISETLTPWPATRDKDLAVHVCKCLYEINDEQRPLLQSKIEKIKLNAVSFSACSLAPTDLTAILHFLESAEEVLYIDLSLNEFGDLEAKEVKNFIVNKERKLKQLNLCNNDFTDTAAKDLAAALEHSNCKLEWLDLSYNNFTDNAAKDLAAALMHGNCKLQHLDLRPTNFSEEVRQNLTDADGHRNCKVLLGHSGNSLVGSLKLRTR